MKFEVMTKGRLVSFDSPHTDAEAAKKLRELVTTGKVTSPFALDLLVKGERYGLSQKQMAWVHKIVVDATAPATKPVVIAPEKRLTKIASMFAVASGALKHPRIDVTVDGIELQLKLAGEMSKYPGTVAITDGRPFGSSRFYARVNSDGTMTAGRDLTDVVMAAIAKLDEQPVVMAAKHGHATGYCCFCRRQLTDYRSVSAGYGPICAGHYGLEWGEVSEEFRTQDQVAQLEELAALTAINENNGTLTVHPA